MSCSGEEVDPLLVTFYSVGFVFAIGLSLWGYLYAKRSLRDLRARALAREQVLNAFTFPEMDDDASDTGSNLERRSSAERRRSFRGNRRDLGFEEEDRRLLQDSALEMSDRTGKHVRRRSESLDDKEHSQTLRAIVIADSSSHADDENDTGSLLKNRTPRSA